MKKLLQVTTLLNLDTPITFIIDLYDSGMSCNQIAEHIKEKTGVIFTPKGIAYFVKKYGKIRTHKESFINSISSGRFDYSKRKPKNKLIKK